ncbi:hypothetical protein SPI_01837 [Niveomyces insectorum RCEF 264]|uniref:Tetratricopeptide repeat protein 36 n=1 Tax=Niveomyces insectorum RCEF 264 TaxID=1081102 RepID=A0A167ZA25_9HYPO|nr:hypothetical protein SPI_01837 [Niveomyces insectorum RCEF 264]
MAGAISLSQRDIDVLGKIRDPESNPASAARLDVSLPKDPHVTDPAEYDRLSQKERELILVMQQAEMELAGRTPASLADPLAAYRNCVADLNVLITEHPQYASARNNRAQALRRLYGDDMLLRRDTPQGATKNSSVQDDAGALLTGAHAATDAERAGAAVVTLSDLDRAISLLLPVNPFLPVLSPTAAKTLSLAYTQRAAVYYATAKHMEPGSGLGLDTSVDRPEAQWTRLDFEEAASRDFAMGGHFGNEIARGLAVGTNPTAKLCGKMVQQMMKSEYGPLS